MAQMCADSIMLAVATAMPAIIAYQGGPSAGSGTPPPSPMSHLLPRALGQRPGAFCMIVQCDACMLRFSMTPSPDTCCIEPSPRWCRKLHGCQRPPSDLPLLSLPHIPYTPLWCFLLKLSVAPRGTLAPGLCPMLSAPPPPPKQHPFLQPPLAAELLPKRETLQS